MSENNESKAGKQPQPSTPPKLRPPDASVESETKSSRTPLLITGIGVTLIILALLVLFLPLQESPEQITPSTQPEQNQPAAGPTPSPATSESNEAALEIKQLIDTWLSKQAAAEAENIAAWGGEEYAGANDQATECDRMLRDQQYLSARQACAAAITQLDELMAGKTERLEEAIRVGNLALDQGEAEAAEASFQQALAIDADDERAQAGARRAAELPGVLQFVAEGTSLETTGDLEGAQRAFAEAARLDSAFPPAQAGLARVGDAIAERNFQQAMSRALQAFSEKRFSSAGQALQQARTIRPNDPAVLDLQQQVARQQTGSQLEKLRLEAATLEQQERWPKALETCKKALSLDPLAAFAVSCTERVSERIELDRRLKALLANPDRLFEDAPLKEAQQLLTHASAITPRGPQLAGQIDRMGLLIAEAEAEVEVVIISDEQTNVAIYHVGKFGRFLEKSLILRTGNYTAIGSRPGFRDVRQTLKVRPGSGKMVFTLRCEEPI